MARPGSPVRVLRCNTLTLLSILPWHLGDCSILSPVKRKAAANRKPVHTLVGFAVCQGLVDSLHMVRWASARHGLTASLLKRLPLLSASQSYGA